jgi:proteasome accessory factor C
MLPWLMQRKRVAIADMAKQFNMSESDLIEDIELASMCGLPPYSPYELTEVFIDDDHILVGPNKHFERRLELTSSEAFGLSLLAAAAEEMPGFTRGKDLKNALKKLRKVLGEGIVDVDVESPQFLNEVTEASQSGERLRMTYWTPARNEESERVVTVRSVFTDRGHWYIAADDDASGDRRHFRVDRIRKIENTGEFVPVSAEPVQVPAWFTDAADKLVVTLEVAPEAAWVVESYPCRSLVENADGSFRAEMVVNSEHWLGRLLLRGDGLVKVIEPRNLAGLQQSVAAQVLANYSKK